MTLLNSRKIQILEAIVNDYVTTTRPVGSERLIETYHLGCKSATVRNEMAELSDMGYLVQPHTSSGRIPTDRGYRFYVDSLMNPALDSGEKLKAERDTRKDSAEIEEILIRTCRILSGMTSYASLATDPAADTARVRRVYVAEASARHVLLVVLLSTGHVVHRLVSFDDKPTDTVLNCLSNYLNSIASEKDVRTVSGLTKLADIPAELTPYRIALARIFRTLGSICGSMAEQRVFLEGANQLLRQPEFQEVSRLESLLSALESHKMLYDVLSRSNGECEVQITIGTESHFAPMKECSVISTTYHIGARPAGYIGVVGPTRMNYERAVASVAFMAINLSHLLTNLSMA